MPTETRDGDELAQRRGGGRKRGAESNGAGDPDANDDAVRKAVADDDEGRGRRGDDEVPELEGQSQLELPIGAGPLTGNVGGRPTSSTFKLRALQLPLAGQVPLDSKLWLLVEADADDVGVKSHRKGRTVTGRVRQHTFTPLSARVLDPDELAAIGVEP